MITMNIRHNGEKHKKIMEALRVRVRAGKREHDKRLRKWEEHEKLMTGYIPEKEADAARRIKREGGKPEYTTIQLPYSYAVAMTAHSYFTTTFLARSPVLQYQGLTGEAEMQIQAIEALINYQTIQARMLAPLYIWLYDAPKYGEGWLGIYWREETVRVANFVEEKQLFMGMIDTGKTKKVKRIQSLPGYKGNSVYNISPRKVLTDPRYPRNRYQDGEFLAVQTELSWMQLKEGEDVGRYMNLEKLKKSRIKDTALGEGEYVSNEAWMDEPDVDAFSTSEDITVSDVFNVYEIYVNLIPETWGLGQGKLPEKWVFTVTTDFSVLLEARPMGHMHNKFPMCYLEIEPEGYSQFSRSLLDIFEPVQNTLDWLINSHFYNVRQVLNNQWIADPSRVEMRDFQTETPGMMVRLKPAAYGSDVRTAVSQFQVQDVTQQNLGDMGMMFSMGERLGINDSVMGLSAPSSRRTAQEIRGAQTFSVSRLKTMTEYFSATGFTDLGGMIVSNTQQYYDQTMKLKIAGDTAALAGEAFVNVSPEDIIGQYSFIPVDGALPVDRYAQANLWREMITQMAKVPQVIAQYDLGKIFGYVAQLSGIKNLSQFRVQVVPDAMALASAAEGNSIPASGGNILEPGQVANMGPTA